MTSSFSGAGSGPQLIPSPEYQEFIVKRDEEQPLSFAGVVRAQGSISLSATTALYAIVYQTRGGKFVAALAKRPFTLLALIPNVDPEVAYFSKAAVFDNVRGAAAWFRPGRLTDDIRAQLGLDTPIRIE